MGFAIEMYFDPVTDQAVRDLWEGLADAGITRIQLDLGTRPHVSLAVVEDGDEEVLAQAVDAFAVETSFIQFTLAHAASFPTDQGVVFLGVTPTQGLIEAHRRFHGRLERANVRVVPYYWPGKWVPHCTMASTVDRVRVGAAVALCSRARLPLVGSMQEVGLVSLEPSRPIRVHRLATHTTGQGGGGSER